MSTRSPRRRLSRRLYCYTFLNDFVLLYPLYALLFTAHGLSVGEVTALFVLWSATSILAEVPSGALADTLSRRALLVAGPLLTASGFLLWGLAPSFVGFAAGFVLWGLGGALRSGAFEALTYDALDRLSATDRYPHTMGRVKAIAAVAVLASAAVASPALTVGGYPLVTAASVAAGLASAVVAAGLPEHSGTPVSIRAAVTEYRHTLRDGLRLLRRDRLARRRATVLALVAGVWGSLEEFIPLLAADSTDRLWLVPLLVLSVAAGQAAGGLAAAPAATWSDRTSAVVLVSTAAATAAAAWWAGVPGFAVLAVAFGVYQLLNVAADARLQDVIDARTRATVTSVAGLGTEFAGIGTYLWYAVAAYAAGHAGGFVAGAAVYLLVAAWWWLPAPRDTAVPASR
ncbi:putative MFS family arabinose efflux permease [Stackebrandtia albiflava]|uniref:Putative MFS family arabinose efflux permease n=1 Tax=Stackebrandtia albiflava TaxID=406432 RepID=A0A562VDD3_9ACTN|nr:MFS transporter [Stackebrandtia albiflava]TWJ15896.1 putative MFS family arabinose efflux permease [Stackebrandtia albiflava]